MSDTTVIAALVTGAFAFLVALIAWVTKLAESSAQREIKATENLRADFTELREEVVTLRDERRDLVKRLDEVVSRCRDQDELIDDMLEIIMWVEGGAQGEVPSVSWRIRQVLARREQDRKDLGP